MQNRRLWTAGSISRKRGGVCARFWAKLELFLNKGGPRVESQKAQGLFSKNARLKRYAQISAVGSRSGGSARRGTWLLIRAAVSRSGGQDLLAGVVAALGRWR